MSYSVEELFKFEKTEDGYSITKYLKAYDPEITELVLPEEYNGLPVTCIGTSAFELSDYLKSIKLPKSLREIQTCAFWLCPELERVEFNSALEFEMIFAGNPKIPPEMIVMNLVGSTDITRPLPTEENFFDILWYKPNDVNPACFRPDVFALLLKNDCFRNCDKQNLLRQRIRENKRELMPAAEQYGMLESAELLDALTEYSAELGKTEITAYLLELKKRKFGFNGGDDFEL